MDLALALPIFALGLAFGSFLNVCIWRLPRGLSVVRPGSACPRCERPIRLYDNVPILSWLILRGRTEGFAPHPSPEADRSEDQVVHAAADDYERGWKKAGCHEAVQRSPHRCEDGRHLWK